MYMVVMSRSSKTIAVDWTFGLFFLIHFKRRHSWFINNYIAINKYCKKKKKKRTSFLAFYLKMWKLFGILTFFFYIWKKMLRTYYNYSVLVKICVIWIYNVVDYLSFICYFASVYLTFYFKKHTLFSKVCWSN